MSPGAPRARAAPSSSGGRRRARARTTGTALVVLAVVTGCSDPSGAQTSAPATPSAGPATSSGGPVASSSPTPPPTAPAPGPAPAPLPTPEPWTAGPGEVRPEVKTAAARFVEGAGSWGSAGDGAAAALVERSAVAGLLGEGVDASALAAALEPLADAGATAAAAEVVYPQYGGLTEDAASVMVVVEQRLRSADGGLVRRGTTLDVRTAPSPDGRWRVTGVRPADARPAPSGARPLVEEVLASPHVRLPDAAAADVRSGLVDDAVLRVLLGVARDHVLDVSVVRTGHPVEVFGTDRTSNHSRGRAVDVWRVDGRPVVDPASRDVVVQALRTAGAAGATEVGGPVDLDGPRQEGQTGGYFSDDLHADHLHLGVTQGRDPIGG
ncbi:hypothetical protein WDZ17_14590 [Pseudokineococcus basanitobsidens]|uniref:Uncharacterized protein n=1 Tax=Pseudokineococcus basanitobsidens TaxID=1926649 RepID=A0ABU8RN44_9ACTN